MSIIYSKSLSPQDQTRVVELLWRMWGDMPTYGLKASQFVDLLGYCTISTPHIMEKVGRKTTVAFPKLTVFPENLRKYCFTLVSISSLSVRSYNSVSASVLNLLGFLKP